MAKTGVYGIESIKFANAYPDGFPSTDPSWSGFTMKAIVKDSFTFNDQAQNETTVEVEDSEDPYAILKDGVKQEGFTIQTYDMDAQAYAFFFGYTSGSTWKTETPNFRIGNKAVQVKTKALGTEFPAKIFEWANMSLNVTKTGTIGKSGFPNIQIECKKLGCFNSSGTAVASARWKNV